jgi:N-acetylglucosaminyl-diphospho-decaprenol L-rhamnosyltransferase
MSITVIIVNFNTCDLLRACIESVLYEAPDEVIVVDNASTDRSSDMMEAKFPSIRLQKNETNIGYGAAANQAIATCTTNYVLLLNSDTFLHQGTIKALTTYMDRNPHVAVLGPRLLDASGKHQPSCLPFPTPGDIFIDVSHLSNVIGLIPYVRDHYLRTWSHGEARSVPWVLGAALLIRRMAFEQVGGFNEKFFMYYEEADLCFRLAKDGWYIHFAPIACISHNGGASTKLLQKEMIVQFYASLAVFYKYHYSRFRMVELVVLVNCIALARLLRDVILLHITHNTQQRDYLGSNIGAWRQLLLNYWFIEGLA